MSDITVGKVEFNTATKNTWDRILKDCRPIIPYATSSERKELKWAVYSGSEKLDLGEKRICCLCSSESQAKHMASFWGQYGYWEKIG